MKENMHLAFFPNRHITPFLYFFMVTLSLNLLSDNLISVVDEAELYIAKNYKGEVAKELAQDKLKKILYDTSMTDEQKMDKIRGIFQESGISETFKKKLRLAEAGNADDQIYVGDCYLKGENIPQNASEAVKWYRKAVEQGSAEAQYKLGICYSQGSGVIKDASEGLKWRRKAAEQGYVEAQIYLGFCYRFGLSGFSKNNSEAFKWYRKAAEQGNAQGQLQLGHCYYFGYGIPQDYSEAVKWYRKAAEQGNVDAKFRLGECYLQGRGVPKDFEKGMKICQDLAEQGNSYCQYSLADIYQYGLYNIHKDLIKAAYWHRKAADQGNHSSIESLGLMYMQGEGVRKDIREAVKWFRINAEKGDKYAQYKLGLCHDLDKSAISEAESLKWMQKAAKAGHADAIEYLKKKIQETDD